MTHHPYISADPNICHGRYCVTGTRVMVFMILDFLEDGTSPEDFVVEFPSVSLEAVNYISEHSEEFKIFLQAEQEEDDKLWIALIEEAEAEGGEYVTLAEFQEGKRSY